MILAALASFWAAVPPARAADVLTCEAFKTRLADALRSVGATNTGADGFTLTHDGGVLGTRYAWTDHHGVSGRLTCATGDAFADFYMALEPSLRPSAEAPADVGGFKALGAASICALSTGTPAACGDTMTTMTTDGINDYKDDIADHDEQPKGLEDYDIANDVEAVLFVTPKTFSFAIGPGVFTTLGTARAVFEPSERDTDDGADNED